MAEGGFIMQNQLRFNLGIPLAASNVAVRYHKPNPIIVERAGGPMNISRPQDSAQPARPGSAQSSIAEDRMALAVRLAQRDLKKRREGQAVSKSPSPKPSRSRVTKGGTKIVYTREAQERAQRLQDKQAHRDALRLREQGWNTGTTVNARTQTPPRDRAARLNLPATTNSPPTRDTDSYPRTQPSDNPGQEIERLQREMEGYLKQIQVIEQRAMQDQTNDLNQPAKSRKKDGYLSDEEDPARRLLRQEEQATRAARQIYNLRQQVRALQEQVTRSGGGRIRHTKKSQVMLRLAAAHRGAVRAIQGFISQLPQQDLRRGLPATYQELGMLIRQLALLSTQIPANEDTGRVHEDLVRMLDRIDELNKAWCTEVEQRKAEEMEERRRKSPAGRQGPQPLPEAHPRQPGQIRKAGKENRPKGLLKKQTYKGSRPVQKSQRPRKVTPERQNVLQAGLQALLREEARQGGGGTAWEIPADDSAMSEPGNTSLILPKGLQFRREKAQRGVTLDVPDTHFTDPTLSSNLKMRQQAEHGSREPWRPGGSTHRSPVRSKSRERSRTRDRSRSVDRNRSVDRSRSRSPRISHRKCLIQDMDEELMHELFPEGVDGMGRRGRSASPRSRSQRQRSLSPPWSPARSRYAAHQIRSRLDRLQHKAQEVEMIQERDRELAEISLRQRLAQEDKAEMNGGLMTDMILNDLLHDTASELQSLEEDDDARDEAVTMHQNPTLENIYQRLEQMELEQIDIRRRWGTLHFEEEEESSSLRKARKIERPSGPVALEISRKDPAQSHRVHSTRAYDKDMDAPIIFTKSAPAPQYNQRATVVESEDDLNSDFPPGIPLRSGKFRLKLPESAVRDIQSSLEKYEWHLRKTAHQAHGNFNPWKLVEEISDQVLSECLKEIEHELEEVEENIVHQVCRSEFAIPESSPVPQSSRQEEEVVEEADRDYGNIADTRGMDRLDELRKIQEQYDVRINQLEVEELSALRNSGEKSLLQSSADKSRENGTSSKKEVSFDQQVRYDDEEESDRREQIFDIAELDPGETETPRDVRDIHTEDVYEDESYEEEEDELSGESPIDSEDLEYSDDET